MLRDFINFVLAFQAASTSDQQKSDGRDKTKTAHKNWSGTMKMKRFVSNEASLVQQLNGLKGQLKGMD